MKFNDIKGAISEIQSVHSISEEEVLSALTNATTSAFRKHIGCPDAQVRLIVNDKTNNIEAYQQKVVVLTDEEIIDDETEISLESALGSGKQYKVGDIYELPITIEDFGRGIVHQFKQVLDQKIKEAAKNAIFESFIDKVDDLIVGKIQTVEDKFVLIDLEKTTAILPKSEQIPNERYKEGQMLKVVIKQVSKESKSAQVVVSRASAMLVKRLFEQQVPEIFDGTVTIKCIAREAGERTKVGVYSKNVNVDPIATCIGPRGQRVSAVIEEITKNANQTIHENVDIFEYSDNMIQLISNAIAPAEILGVYPKEDGDGYMVVVPDEKLSVAIGKRGINARLIVKLINAKIDIKTKSALEELGIDWYNNYMMYQAKLESELRVKEVEEEVKIEETVVEEPIIEEPVVELNKDNATEKEAKEIVKRRKAAKIEAKASEYVSKFEELADAKKQTEVVTSKKKKKEEDQEEIERKRRLEELKNRQAENKISYEDYDEFEKDGDDEVEWYDDEDEVDYDEYDEFYDEK